MQADYKVSEITKLLRVSKNTVLDWIRAGAIVAYNAARPNSARPSYRITVKALEDFRQSRAAVPVDEQAETQRKRRRRPQAELKQYF